LITPLDIKSRKMILHNMLGSLSKKQWQLRVWLLVSIGLLHGIPATQASGVDLFSYQESDVSHIFGHSESSVTGVYQIQFNRQASSVEVGRVMNAALPDNNTIAITVAKKEHLDNGDVQISGSYANDGWMIMTIGKDSAYANFSNTEHSFSLNDDPRTTSFLIDNRTSNAYQVDLQDDFIIPPHILKNGRSPNLLGDRVSQANTNRESCKNSFIGFMALYSPEFGNGFANPVTRINQMLGFTNAAYKRSGIKIELKLVHARQVGFENKESTGNLLNLVTAGREVFSNVPSLRTTYGADLVAVLPFSSGGLVRGRGWINGDSRNYGYSVSQFAIWGSDSVFAHEIGHNMGSGHERISSNPSHNSPCNTSYTFTNYACGHGNASHPDNWGTIMSYLNDGVIGYKFSNPNLNCLGAPCGIPAGQANAADNASAFNISREFVANFYKQGPQAPACDAPTFMPPVVDLIISD